MKTKVLFFVNSYAGGAEKMTLNIASFLDIDLYEIVFYVLGGKGGLITEFIPKNARIEYLGSNETKYSSVNNIRKVLRIEEPDYVFSSLMPINWRLCFAAVFLPKVKVIIRVNNYLYTQSLSQKIRLFISYRFANKIIVQTDEMLHEHLEILKLPKSKVVTLANPVNTKQIDNKLAKETVDLFSKEIINYVYVGRIDKVKGLDSLIKAFSKLIIDQPNSKLYLVGDNTGIFLEYYNELKNLGENLRISDKLSFEGFSSNPYLYMKYADCFVLPSRNEGLPNVVIEALYLGTPVAVTKSVPVITRIVSEGINGYVTEVDNVEGLAVAMINASKLGRVMSTYKSASKEDFQQIFNT